MWRGVIWYMERCADKVAEPLIGGSYTAKVRLNSSQPTVRLVFKMSEDCLHILDGDLLFPQEPGNP